MFDENNRLRISVDIGGQRYDLNQIVSDGTELMPVLHSMLNRVLIDGFKMRDPHLPVEGWRETHQFKTAPERRTALEVAHMEQAKKMRQIGMPGSEVHYNSMRMKPTEPGYSMAGGFTGHTPLWALKKDCCDSAGCNGRPTLYADGGAWCERHERRLKGANIATAASEPDVTVGMGSRCPSCSSDACRGAWGFGCVNGS